MNRYILIILLFAISTNHLVNSRLSNLNLESIIGGYVAHERTYKYHVTIQGIFSYANKFSTACSGAVIHDFFVLSVAHCFVDNHGVIANTTYAVYAAVTDLSKKNGMLIAVDKIYLPGFDPRFDLYDIAVVQLKTTLNLDNNFRVSKLTLPIFRESFTDDVGTVSGFGYDWIQAEVDNERGSVIRVRGGSIPLLKFAHVRIVEGQECKNNFPGIATDSQLCGLMYTDRPDQIWGTCTGDSGGPLVVNNKLVGIVNKNIATCDDTYTGALYTKVSVFSNFINSILEGHVPEYTMTYVNWPYARGGSVK